MVTLILSPQAMDFVFVKYVIVAHDRQAFNLCLGDEHAIKRVTMRAR
jgi:hypothetical protein